MSFFIKGKQVNGIKRAKYSTDKSKKRKPKAKPSKNEEITSSEDEGLVNNEEPEVSSSEDERETAQEKKLRLAKIYLKEIENEERARLQKEDIDEGDISKRLKEDYLKETGRLRMTVADRYKRIDEDQIQILKCREHRSSITCLCVTTDDQSIIAGSKDGVVVSYSLTKSRKERVIPFVKQSNTEEIIGHTKQILSIAISSDNKFLAVGTETSDIFIWEPQSFKFIKKLTGHKNAITGLCFKRDTHTLYSCSRDRTAKVWSLDEMAYVETLFGHQNIISSMDTLYKDRLVSCGCRDLRLWKITEETQLIYNGHSGNIDNVKMINEENFITGGDDGQICVWSMLRKKPLCVVQDAHGIDPSNQQPYWISALAALTNADLAVSGSQDGFIRLWKLENNFKACKMILKVPVEGFVNCLSFTSDASKLIVATGKEHKLGRWSTVKSAKNCIMVVPFIKE
ncbi:unnamed protein product [Phaedon cochleariae]|uniref:U3 small nucleolar RNA-interacting protein 2 n=1 Tax=Phaedon cochleariae TaxID=80249 RepID=A0A9P0GPC0_PHACE|nr:unnamed protein product [Phaedon cochleariae]